MKLRTCFFSLLFAAALQPAWSQDSIPELTARDSMVTSYWLAGVGINIVDDSGEAFNNFTTIENQWNMVPYPSRVSFGRYFKSGIGLELIGTYNRYKAGNTIDGQTIAEDIPYWAVDSRISYDLNHLVGETGFFDPYLGAGLGYTDASNEGQATVNAVVGFRLWLSKQWGVDLNSSGKWRLADNVTNHIQHAAGVVYRFGIEEGLTRKGAEKAAMREELLAALQRRQDSIRQAEEAAEQARLLQEQEEQRLAAQREEAARKAAEAARKDALKRELDSIGGLRFAFDSSYLDAEAKAKLEAIAAFMKRNPELTFSIQAHADSRGPEKYNQWLTERRAQRVADYLTGEGIRMERLQVEGLGESQLLNHCSDGVRCTAAEHAVNRRGVVYILAY